MDSFYGDIHQHLKAWSAAPPRLRPELDPADVQPASVASTAQSSQDGTAAATDGPNPLPTQRIGSAETVTS